MIHLETSYRFAYRPKLRGDIIIIIDALRFSSSVVTGLSHGVEAFIPVKTLKEARSLYRRDSDLILAGERRGLKPKSFHMGNSPREFENADLEGKRVVITTTNGTMALRYAMGARWILIGSFLNAKAITSATSKLLKNEGGISLLLASRNGMFFLEDFLCAGLLVSNLGPDLDVDDKAAASRLAWTSAEDRLEDVVRRGLHAKYLESIGYGEDVSLCLRRDIYSTVPYLRRGEIVRLQI